MQEKVKIEDEDNAGVIHDKLMLVGSKLVCKTVDMLLENKVDAVDQSQFFTDENDLKAAPKIFKETCRIDWNKPAKDIHNLIRGECRPTLPHGLNYIRKEKSPRT